MGLDFPGVISPGVFRLRGAIAPQFPVALFRVQPGAAPLQPGYDFPLEPLSS